MLSWLRLGVDEDHTEHRVLGAYGISHQQMMSHAWNLPWKRFAICRMRKASVGVAKAQQIHDLLRDGIMLRRVVPNPAEAQISGGIAAIALDPQRDRAGQPSDKAL